jgi:hypothetical protein
VAADEHQKEKRGEQAPKGHDYRTESPPVSEITVKPGVLALAFGATR